MKIKKIQSLRNIIVRDTKTNKILENVNLFLLNIQSIIGFLKGAWDLAVKGTGYKVDKNKDVYVVKRLCCKARKTNVVSKETFHHYFESISDYNIEPELIRKESDDIRTFS